MTHKSYNNSIMSHTSTEQGNVIIEDDDLSGTRLLRDSDNGCNCYYFDNLLYFLNIQSRL